jgi:hypothetical protein
MCFQYLPKAEKSQALESPGRTFLRRRAPLTRYRRPSPRSDVPALRRLGGRDCPTRLDRRQWLPLTRGDPELLADLAQRHTLLVQLTRA